MRRRAADTERHGDWPTLAILGWAIVAGAIASTEFLAQTFIWRWWSLQEIASVWASILAARLLVSVAIAGGVIVAIRWRAPQGARPIALLAVSILAGATAGEGLAGWLAPDTDRWDLAARTGRILAWSLSAGAMIGILAAWRRGASDALAIDDTRLRAAEMRKFATATRVEALQRQIEPHFLFNTLATVKRLGRTSPEEGRRLLSRLLDFFAASLSSGRAPETPIDEELELVAAYLDVCRARMGPRLQVVWDVDPTLRGVRIPSLMLATLAENAIKHGVAPARAGGTVTTFVRRQGARLEVGVEDTGVGLRGESGSGIGLANLMARLRMFYGQEGRFSLEAVAGGGVRATIGLPSEGLSP